MAALRLVDALARQPGLLRLVLHGAKLVRTRFDQRTCDEEADDKQYGE